MMFRMTLVSLLFFIMIGLFGCEAGERSASTGKSSEPGVASEPVTLGFYTQVALTDTEFAELIVKPAKLKYPHITLERFTASPDKQLPDLIAAGKTPDIIYWSNAIQPLLELNLPLDLNQLLKENKLDLSVFEPAIVDSMRNFGPKGEIYSLPFAGNTIALFYNKAIFDKFGVEYPKDGMRWEDAIELAKRVSRTVDGVQYRGLDPYLNGRAINIASPLSMRLVDSKTDKALIDEKWKMVFQMMMDFYSIPSNRPVKLTNAVKEFTAEMKTAMLPFYYNGILTHLESAADLQWDVVQHPSYKEAPNSTNQVSYHQFVVSRTSKHIPDAFKVISTAVHPDVQTASSKMGKIPVLNNPEIFKQFAVDMKLMKGKNVAGIFKSKNAPAAFPNKYDDIVLKELDSGFQNIFDGLDMNTALRQAEERANALILTEKAK